VSVYKRSYNSYSGPLTPVWSRFLVVARYGLAEVWESRVTNILFLVCLGPVLLALVTVYVMNSDTAQLLMGVNRTPLLSIDNRFFLKIFHAQCWLALVLTAWVGPRLMAGDLGNNALPTILSRPLDRAEYIAGKLSVLFLLLSGITWAPTLLLFLFQAQLSKHPWASQNRFIASGVVLGALAWITVLSLLSLALASWVKWRVVSTGLVFGAVFVPAGVGEVFNGVLRTNWGSLLNLPYLMTLIWSHLLRVPVFFMRRQSLPVEFALAALIIICTACVLVLRARIRGQEVVRG
jgi:ABC-type transport system involved in multi-copper enzyme maturation permease subunit